MSVFTTKKIGGWQRTAKKLNSNRILKERLDRYIRYRKTLKKLANDLHKCRQIKPKALDDENYKQTTNHAYAHVCHAIWSLDQSIVILEALIPELSRKKAPFYCELTYTNENGLDFKKG